MGKTTDAVEIICHGGANGDVGKVVGFLDFGDESRIYAKKIGGEREGRRSITDLDYISATEININACNSANPDIYNMVWGMMQQTDSDWYSGFDGGAEWSDDLKDHKRGNGEVGTTWKHPNDPFYYVKKYQSTWYKYVAKDANGYPLRLRVGRRIFDGDYKNRI